MYIRIVVVLCWILGVGLSMGPFGTAYGANSGSKQFVIVLPININTANALTISRALSGVGSKKAAAIVTYRQDNGPFATIDELTRVKGIGKGTLSKNQGRISVE